MPFRKRLAAIALGALFAAACAPERREPDDAAASTPREGMALDELRSGLIAAGIPAAAIRRGHDPYYPEVEILLLSPSDRALARADRAAMARLSLDSGNGFGFTAADQEKAFAPFVVTEIARRDREAAIAALTRQGRLDEVPRLKAGEPMAVFTRRIDRFCGVSPGPALRVVELRWLEFNPDFVRDSAVAESEGRPADSFRCVKQVIDATGLHRHFIGNRFRSAGGTD